MLLRLATLGALGYAAYRYYDKNRDQVDGALRRLSQSDADPRRASEEDSPELAGGPLSSKGRVVHAGEGPVA